MMAITKASLRMLYPRDLARTLIKTFNDAQPSDDTVLLGGVTPEELDQMFAGDKEETEEENPTAEEMAGFAQMKQALRDDCGKKASDVPMSPEEASASLEKEIDAAIDTVLRSWLEMLGIALIQGGGNTVRLTERLEPVVPILLNRDRPDVTWQDAASLSISLSAELTDQLYESFVDRLRPLIDAAPNGLIFPCRPVYAICKDAQGYCLVLRS